MLIGSCTIVGIRCGAAAFECVIYVYFIRGNYELLKNNFFVLNHKVEGGVHGKTVSIIKEIIFQLQNLGFSSVTLSIAKDGTGFCLFVAGWCVHIFALSRRVLRTEGGNYA